MQPANVLLICSDEHDPRYMGCSGHPLVKTPNMDKLAARGTRFTNAYTSSPICVPARASLATGLYPHQNGYWDNAIAYDGRFPSFGHELRRERMRVDSIGKLHYRNASDDTGFDHQYEAMHIHNGVGLIWASVRDPLRIDGRRSPLFDELGPGTSSYNRYDLAITRTAVEWLQQAAGAGAGKPWCLNVGFVAPHMPFVVPQKYLDLYPWQDVPVPDKLLPSAGHPRHPWVEMVATHWDHDTALGMGDRRRMAVACYFELVSFLDEQIGVLVETLERTGALENTRIIYTTDHGDTLGTRGLWNKCTLYRESTAVPMIVAGSGLPQGKVCSTNVNLVDVYPAILDGMGVAHHEGPIPLPGKSLFQLANQPDDPERLGFSEYHALGSPSAGYMLAKGGHKYHHYIGFPAELFDLEADPEELANLAGQPAYAPVVAGFEDALRRMLDPVAVDRRAKADQNEQVRKFGGIEAVQQIGNQTSTATPEKYRMV